MGSGGRENCNEQGKRACTVFLGLLSVRTLKNNLHDSWVEQLSTSLTVRNPLKPSKDCHISPTWRSSSHRTTWNFAKRLWGWRRLRDRRQGCVQQCRDSENSEHNNKHTGWHGNVPWCNIPFFDFTLFECWTQRKVSRNRRCTVAPEFGTEQRNWMYFLSETKWIVDRTRQQAVHVVQVKGNTRTLQQGLRSEEIRDKLWRILTAWCWGGGGCLLQLNESRIGWSDGTPCPACRVLCAVCEIFWKPSNGWRSRSMRGSVLRRRRWCCVRPPPWRGNTEQLIEGKSDKRQRQTEA